MIECIARNLLMAASVVSNPALRLAYIQVTLDGDCGGNCSFGRKGDAICDLAEFAKAQDYSLGNR